eukprot:SAG31_NODE_464_length_15318_cov_17.930876_3_plen_211_part_00
MLQCPRHAPRAGAVRLLELFGCRSCVAVWLCGCWSCSAAGAVRLPKRMPHYSAAEGDAALFGCRSCSASPPRAARRARHTARTPHAARRTPHAARRRTRSCLAANTAVRLVPQGRRPRGPRGGGRRRRAQSRLNPIRGAWRTNVLSILYIYLVIIPAGRYRATQLLPARRRPRRPGPGGGPIFAGGRCSYGHAYSAPVLCYSSTTTRRSC